MDFHKTRRSDLFSQFIAGKTQWRAYMNIHAEQVMLQAPVLDIGAGVFGTASYQRYIPNYDKTTVYALDYVPERRPSVMANLYHPLPFRRESIGTLIAFNVLEYMYDFEGLLREVNRVLMPESMIYIAVPFLDRVHSDPGDALRFTAYAIRRMLTDSGFDEIEITPHGTGAAAAALDMVEFAVPRLLRGLCLRLALWLDALFTRRSGGKYRNADDYPLGYFVSARKRGGEA